MAEHLYTYVDPPVGRDIDLACRILEDGGVIAYSNEINWAFACDAANAKALDRIRRLKPFHPKERPFALVCDSISMASKISNIGTRDYRLLKRAWPGPFTVLLNAHKSLPRQIKDKRRVVGVRVPAAPLVQALIQAYGKPLATTSAPPLAFNADPKEVAKTFPKFGFEIYEAYGHCLDLILDLGTEASGLESTVIDLTSEIPTVVRSGVGDAKLFEM